jgi:type IV pilus assembly protein PilP
VVWNNKIIVAVFAVMSSGLLLGQPPAAQVKASDELILEDTSADAAKKLRKYGAAEEVVNAIQRDPFYRLLEGLADKEHSITDYELSEFTLIGTVWGVAKPIGMFKGPKDRRYMVKVGDRIGRNNGVVINIDKGEVLIREFYTDINNKKIEKSTIKRVEKPV